MLAHIAQSRVTREDMNVALYRAYVALDDIVVVFSFQSAAIFAFLAGADDLQQFVTFNTSIDLGELRRAARPPYLIPNALQWVLQLIVEQPLRVSTWNNAADVTTLVEWAAEHLPSALATVIEQADAIVLNAASMALAANVVRAALNEAVVLAFFTKIDNTEHLASIIAPVLTVDLATRGFTNAIAHLLRRGYVLDDNTSLLVRRVAAQQDNVELYRLFDDGGNVSDRLVMAAASGRGARLLSYFVRRNPDVVLGIDTLLVNAVESSSTAALTLLFTVRRQWPAEKLNEALYIAMVHGTTVDSGGAAVSDEMLAMLLRRGAVFPRNAKRVARLYETAVGNENVRMMRFISQHAPADVQLEYTSYLHVAATDGFPDVIKELLARGADPANIDGRGTSPLEKALKRDFFERRVLFTFARIQAVRLLTAASPADSVARAVKTLISSDAYEYIEPLTSAVPDKVTQASYNALLEAVLNRSRSDPPRSKRVEYTRLLLARAPAVCTLVLLVAIASDVVSVAELRLPSDVEPWATCMATAARARAIVASAQRKTLTKLNIGNDVTNTTPRVYMDGNAAVLAAMARAVQSAASDIIWRVADIRRQPSTASETFYAIIVLDEYFDSIVASLELQATLRIIGFSLCISKTVGTVLLLDGAPVYVAREMRLTAKKLLLRMYAGLAPDRSAIGTNAYTRDFFDKYVFTRVPRGQEAAWVYTVIRAPTDDVLMQQDVMAIRQQIAAGADVNVYRGAPLTHWLRLLDVGYSLNNTQYAIAQALADAGARVNDAVLIDAEVLLDPEIALDFMARGVDFGDWLAYYVATLVGDARFVDASRILERAGAGVLDVALVKPQKPFVAPFASLIYILQQTRHYSQTALNQALVDAVNDGALDRAQLLVQYGADASQLAPDRAAAVRAYIADERDDAGDPAKRMKV